MHDTPRDRGEGPHAPTDDDHEQADQVEVFGPDEHPDRHRARHARPRDDPGAVRQVPLGEPQQCHRHEQQPHSQGRPEGAHLDRPQTQQLTRKDRKQRRQGAGAECVTSRG